MGHAWVVKGLAAVIGLGLGVGIGLGVWRIFRRFGGRYRLK